MTMIIHYYIHFILALLWYFTSLTFTIHIIYHLQVASIAECIPAGDIIEAPLNSG
jgi:hypothetical protein